MSEEEVRDLIERYREGDEEAGERLFARLRPLVSAYAGRMAYREEEREDYFQAGMIGLLKAVRRFDPHRGVKFVTLALPWIEGEMRLYRRRTQSVLKVSRSLVEQSRALASCRERLSQMLQREPTVGEIGRAMEIPPEEVALVMESLLPPSPLVEETFAGGEQEAGEQEKLLDRMALQESMARLTPLERRLINLRFFKELTQSETAGCLSLSQRQVSRLERRTLQRLRSHMQPESRAPFVTARGIPEE